MTAIRGAQLIAVLAVMSAVLAGRGSSPVTIHGTLEADDFAHSGTCCAFTTDSGYSGISLDAQVIFTAPDGTVLDSGALASQQAVMDTSWPLVTLATALLASSRGSYLCPPDPSRPALAACGGQRGPGARAHWAAVKEMPVSSYSAVIETRADDGLAVGEGALGLLLNAVQPFHGTVSGGIDPPGWSARISIEARDAADAVALAAALVTRLAADVGLPAWPVVRAQAAREDLARDPVMLPS